MTLSLLLTALGAVLLVALVRMLGVLRRGLAQRPEPIPLDRYPSVTVIRPIKGLDAGARENLRAALELDYPAPVETLFVFDGPDEPAYRLAREAIAARWADGRPTDARVIFSGEPPAGRTGKLNAMIAGFGAARGELIAFVDSDTRADPRSLRTLVETLLGSPGAGAAFAPVVATAEPATLGDAGYALLLNGLYGPAAAETVRRNGGELPFIMGQFSVFTREALAAIDGLESADGQLVDDMYLGLRVKAAGYRNVVSPHRVPIIQHGSSLREFWLTYVRWIAFSRSGLPVREFKRQTYVLPVLYWVGLLAAAVSIAAGLWLPAVLNAAVPAGIALALNRLHRQMGGAPLGAGRRVASFLLLLVAPLVLGTIAWKHEVTWRGRSYKLDAGSRLAAVDAAADRSCADVPGAPGWSVAHATAHAGDGRCPPVSAVAGRGAWRGERGDRGVAM